MYRVFISCLITMIVMSSQAAETSHDAPPKQKILFLTNSTFHAYGGAMTPFNGYCDDAGAHYIASGSYGYFKSTPEGQRISPYMTGQIKDPRILELIKTGNFAFVLLVTRWTVFQSEDGTQNEINAFKKFHEHIVRSGAQTIVSMSYVSRNSTNNADQHKSNIAKLNEVKNALSNMIIDGKKHPIVLAPTGILWGEGVKKFGIDAWFADAVHGTPLAQHASGCLFFTFITGEDPRENAYVDLYAEEAYPQTKLSPDQATWVREQVWSLYQKYK